jgi:hypothetical protein
MDIADWRIAQKKRHLGGGAGIFLPQEEVDRKSSPPSRRRRLKNDGLRPD